MDCCHACATDVGCWGDAIQANNEKNHTKSSVTITTYSFYGLSTATTFFCHGGPVEQNKKALYKNQNCMNASSIVNRN